MMMSVTGSSSTVLCVKIRQSVAMESFCFSSSGFQWWKVQTILNVKTLSMVGEKIVYSLTMKISNWLFLKLDKPFFS